MKITFSSIRRFLLAAGMATAVPLSAAAWQGHVGGPGACGGGMPGGPGKQVMWGDMLPPYLHGLNLSEAQRDKVFAIMHAQAPAIRDKAKAVHKAEDDLRTLVAAPDYSAAKARALADSAAKAMAEMTLARTQVDRQVFELLTPEQRKQVAERKPGGVPPHGAAPGA